MPKVTIPSWSVLTTPRRYRDSLNTDLRRTFRAARRSAGQVAAASQPELDLEPQHQVLPFTTRRDRRHG